MFKSRGFFKHVPCPGKHDCNLPNCIFNHEFVAQDEAISNKSQVYDPAVVSQSDSPPPLKRRRLDSKASSPTDAIPLTHSVKANNNSSETNGTQLATHTPNLHSQTLKRKHVETFVNIEHNDEFPPLPQTKQMSRMVITNDVNASDKTPASATKSVSPPPVARKMPINKPAIQLSKPIQEEPFHPRRIDHPPLQLSERDKKLKLFFQNLKKKQDTFRQSMAKEPQLLMSTKELEKLALDEEENIAKSASAATYTTMLSGRLVFYNKMSEGAYKTWILKYRSAAPTAETVLDTRPGPVAEVDTGLGSVEKEVSILKMLRTGLAQHEQHGYIVKKPSDEDITRAKAADVANQGFEKCDRCERRFQVFPGRDPATGQLASGGHCYHHWGRYQQGKFTCCNQQAGGRTCSTAETHVFKTTDPARLAALWQFQETSDKSDGKKRGPVVFDCEMVYTTHGLELVRVTALSWPLKTTLLDVLVEPFGEILDLNTRFSGVTPQMYADAPMYNEAKPPKYTPDVKLHKVKSPKFARDLLFDLLDSKTPLIGHAIENDLNACRIIHPFVIDTVLLYPSVRGLPFRRKLKDLAKEHLRRSIQNESADGHDSKEDSEATGDLARVKVKEKWNQLAMQGFWWTDAGVLLTAQSKPKAGMQTVLSSPRHRMG